ncbi:hypothetical protein ACFQ09_01600 [Massilia norwichensis]|uniref:Uncharacterized protein n=1 Tax=Massilia norwichensis TaxID=1442366 RepID=A0ABT2A099_9BURK|nr:hypothetical protein [Massilia norwichensis]MCS0587609.1 hypothetical protein [Massilia norwichensis]
MTMYIRRIDRFTANQAFNAFVFMVIGWVMLEGQLFKVGAGIRPQLIAMGIGGIICTIALRRCRVWWPDSVGDRSSAPLLRNIFNKRNLFSCAMLAGIGVLLGLNAKSDSCFLFALLIMALTFAPWSRIEFCRKHVFISITSLLLGAVASYVSMKGSSNVLTTLFNAWVLWTSGIAAVLSTYRKPHEMPKEVTGTPELDQRAAKDAAAHR